MTRRIRISGLRLAGLAALATAALVIATGSASAGNGGKCLIVNPGGGGGTWSVLQAAVDAASPGDTLVVKGTCVGSTTVSTNNLTIVGQSNPGFGPATLDGNHSGRVLTIGNSSGNLTISNLTITNGTATGTEDDPFALGGGGILYAGGEGTSSVTLNNTSVIGNTTNAYLGGGGILSNGGPMTLNNSTVTGNTATFNPATAYGGGFSGLGGGIANWGNGGLLTLNNSTVTGNTALSGGGIYNQGGSVTLSGTNVLCPNSTANFGFTPLCG